MSRPMCPIHGVELTYQQSDEDVGISECYYCPEESCLFVIPQYEFDQYDMDL